MRTVDLFSGAFAVLGSRGRSPRLVALALLAGCAGGEVTLDDGDDDGFLATVDCDDGDPDVHPGADDPAADGTDQDCDGHDGPKGAVVDADQDGFPAAVDCDDDDASVHPGANELVGDGLDQDCSGADGVATPDQDEDGYGEAVDCDDADPDVHPGALETAGDEVDSNCDGADGPSSADADGDGYASLAYHGTDCDDADPTVHPDAADARGDDVDDDCDGADFRAALLTPGDLVITEIMYDSDGVPDGDGEWFEVLNTTGHAVNLQGLVVADDSAFGTTDVFTVGTVLVASPGERVVFGTNGDPVLNGGIGVDYDYRGRGVSLNNSADDVLIGVPSGRSYTVIDAVSYDEAGGWPMAKGASVELKDTSTTATANDSAGSWCLATGTAGTTTDKGSPGAPSSGC